MRFDVSVHSPRIGFEVRAILCRGNLERFLRRHPQPQNPLLAVVLEKVIAKNLGNFAGGESPHHVHLPQTVLRGDIPLSKKEVVEICGLDRGYAVSVTNDRDPGGEAGNLHVSVQLGQGRARDGVEPGQRSQRQRAIQRSERKARTRPMPKRVRGEIEESRGGPCERLIAPGVPAG